jgi:hypothetical protein
MDGAGRVEQASVRLAPQALEHFEHVTDDMVRRAVLALKNVAAYDLPAARLKRSPGRTAGFHADKCEHQSNTP